MRQEEKKIFAGILDKYTIKNLTKLIDEKYFTTLDFPISTGKEADVYKASKIEKSGDKKPVAVKMYRVETSNFKKMQDYLIGDPRFARIRKSKRGIIETWCQKEFRNLKDAYEMGIKVPKPIAFEKNVLVMEFIGKKNGTPYPLLKEVEIENWNKLINTLLKYIEAMWKKAKIVHGDLNEYNIIMKNQTPIIIDIGQAMSIKHPYAPELLKRDLTQIKKLAKKHKIKVDVTKVYKKLTSEVDYD